MYIRRRRVPLSEVYSLISKNFHLVHTSGTGQSCVEVNASVQYNGRGAATPDERFGMFMTRHNGWGFDSSLEGSRYSPRLMCTRCSLMDSLWLSTSMTVQSMTCTTLPSPNYFFLSLRRLLVSRLGRGMWPCALTRCLNFFEGLLNVALQSAHTNGS